MYVKHQCSQLHLKKTIPDLKVQAEPTTVMVGDINIPLSPTDRSFRPKKRTKKPQN
jgi:hypothetical protein